MATMVAVILTVGVVGPQAAKPDPTPNWRCRVTLRDASGDKIQSDGAGSYVDGLGGVTCYIVNEPGVAHDRWLFLSLPSSGKRGPERFFRYIGQTFEGASYPSFSNWGTFEVKGLAKVAWNPTGPSPRDVMPFRAYIMHPQLPFADGYALLSGDSNIVGSFGFDGTSSVFVQPIDACSWQVTCYTTEEPDLFIGTSGERATRTTPRLMRLTQGSRNPANVGDFPMAFQATVAITANKPGCPLP